MSRFHRELTDPTDSTTLAELRRRFGPQAYASVAQAARDGAAPAAAVAAAATADGRPRPSGLPKQPLPHSHNPKQKQITVNGVQQQQQRPATAGAVRSGFSSLNASNSNSNNSNNNNSNTNAGNDAAVEAELSDLKSEFASQSAAYINYTQYLTTQLAKQKAVNNTDRSQRLVSAVAAADELRALRESVILARYVI